MANETLTRRRIRVASFQNGAPLKFQNTSTPHYERAKQSRRFQIGEDGEDEESPIFSALVGVLKKNGLAIILVRKIYIAGPPLKMGGKLRIDHTLPNLL